MNSRKILAFALAISLCVFVIFYASEEPQKAASPVVQSAAKGKTPQTGAASGSLPAVDSGVSSQAQSSLGASSKQPERAPINIAKEELGSSSASVISSEDFSDLSPKAAEAVRSIFTAADAGDTRVIQLFTNPQELGACPWCNEMFEKLADVLTDPQSSDGRRFFASQILSLARNVESTKQLLNAIKSTNDPTQRENAIDALGLTKGTDEIIDLVNTELKATSDAQTRQALVAMLGYQHSLAAAEGLYNDLLTHGEPEGFAEKGIGLVIFSADESAIPFLRDKAALGDKYSAIALTSLLESGEQGGEEALVALNRMRDQASAEKIAAKSATLVRWRNPESWLFLRERLAAERDPKTAKFISLLTPGPSPR